MTGIQPASCRRRTMAVSTLTMSPTCPRSMNAPGWAGSGIASFLAWSKPPSRPLKPTALPPAWLIRPTICCCTSPDNTHSTACIVAASVTRMPWMNSPRRPRRLSAASICGPPPCTITGRMPTSCSITTSCAKAACKAGSVMALPPYLMTMVRPWYWRKKGKAAARTSAAIAGVGGVTGAWFMVGAGDRMNRLLA